jgi:hypothetical protein
MENAKSIQRIAELQKEKETECVLFVGDTPGYSDGHSDTYIDLRVGFREADYDDGDVCGWGGGILDDVPGNWNDGN